MRKRILLFFSCLSVLSATGQKTDRQLTEKIQAAIKGFNGTIGIYVQELRTGKTVMINADTIFPTASIVKVPILIGIMDKLERDSIQYDENFVYKDSLFYAGEDAPSSFKNDEKIRLKKVMMLSLTTSDNTASLWLQGIAGKGERINQLLDSFGFKDTRVNSRTPGREGNRAQYGWGQTTPREMGEIFEKIYRNELYSPAACERMMRCLGRNYWDENEAISMIPPYIAVFSKNGCVDATRNEILLVNAPHHPYIFSIFTKNNKDTSWTHENEAWALTRQLSSLLWHYFEPKDKWEKPQPVRSMMP